jgi:transposase InsO family protein
LVLKPPRERPRPWASAPLFAGERRRRADAPARSSSRSSAIRDRPRAPTRQGSRPERPSRSGRSAASPPRACPTAWADRASDSLRAIHSRAFRNRRLLVRGPRLPLRSPGTNASSRSHWSSRSASQPKADLPKISVESDLRPFGNPRSLNRHCDLGRACATTGYPKTIRVDHGTEFVSRDLDLWAYAKGVTLDFSRPGKPTKNLRGGKSQWQVRVSIGKILAATPGLNSGSGPNRDLVTRLLPPDSECVRSLSGRFPRAGTRLGFDWPIRSVSNKCRVAIRMPTNDLCGSV